MRKRRTRGLSWGIFWKKHISHWRCSVRRNNLSRAYLEVLLEEGFCPAAFLFWFQSVKTPTKIRANLILMWDGHQKGISSALVQGSSHLPQ
uniref:Uncharacterized protein n=1 Tax=Melopsittacus undulatus TaxID=13146 RepID=A0A8V5FQ17_MELUD